MERRFERFFDLMQQSIEGAERKGCQASTNLRSQFLSTHPEEFATVDMRSETFAVLI
jgi:hypothetical protein